MAKERFGFLGIKGPKEKMFGGRRGNETRKEWKARIGKEADLGSKANKENLTKRDIGKAKTAIRQAGVQQAGRPAATVTMSRDMALVNGLDAAEGDILGVAGDVAELEARIIVLEAVQEEGDDVIDGLGGGIGNIVGFLDPLVAGINAADVPTIPLAAQAGYALTVWSANMNDGAVFGLGKNTVRMVAFFLRVIAYYRPEVGLASLFQTDAGGIFGGTGTLAAPTAVEGAGSLV